MPFQFKESPDRMRLEQTFDLSFDDYEAHTFCFPVSRGTRRVLATSERAHTFIFNALKAIVKDPKNTSRILKDYGVKLSDRLNAEDLREISKNIIGSTMGQQRLITDSGRVWVGVHNKVLGKFHAVSTWSNYERLHENPWIMAEVVSFFKLRQGNRPIYYEGIDFKQPLPWTFGPEDPENKKSTVDPDLSSDQIVDILSRAHYRPFDLTAKEREVAIEFRGRAIGRKYQHLFPTDAEFKSKLTTSESIAWRRGLLNNWTVPTIVESLLENNHH